MSRRAQTPSATVGPYFAMKIEPLDQIASPQHAGQHIRVKGRIFDGAGAPVEDALIEIWQANAAGRYRHPADRRQDLPLEEGFLGYGRAHSAFEDGRFSFSTIKPGRTPTADGVLQAPHLTLILTARGMLNHLYTRLYFADEAAANAEDPILLSVPEGRRKTLIAQALEGEGPATYNFDIHLQGADETVFFDV